MVLYHFHYIIAKCRLLGIAHVIYVEGRDSIQDPGHAMEQLVERAVRALSPGANAPFLSLQCINQICAALVLVAGRLKPLPGGKDRGQAFLDSQLVRV